MWFYVHLLPASAHNGEDLSARNDLSQALLLLNRASKSFMSSPDVSVFWTKRNRMYCRLSLKTWASTNREGGILHLTAGTRLLLAWRSRVGPGCFTNEGCSKEPLLNHWDQCTKVRPIGANLPHLSKLLILLKFYTAPQCLWSVK